MWLELALLMCLVHGHGHATFPDSFRMGGSLEKGGDCTNGACFWFSNNVEIPGPPTLPDRYRTVNIDAKGERDVFKTSPWRAPGTAPVFGSGCGVAGGDSVYYANGGNPPKGIEQGFDGVDMPAMPATTWHRGKPTAVAWAVSANHGGGYSYRLCKNDGNVTEACFQENQLKFYGNQSWILYSDGTKSEPFTNVKVTEGVYPPGSEWLIDPVPGCNVCDFLEKCGAPLDPVPGKVKSDWDDQVNCYGLCDGAGESKAEGRCPEGMANFPELSPGISGFGKSVYDWSVLDMVLVPKDLEPGDYLLSWRWDCEESTQVWQNCADITVV